MIELLDIVLSRSDSQCSIDLNSECLTCVFSLASKFFEMIKILSYALQQKLLLLWDLKDRYNRDLRIVSWSSEIWRSTVIVIFAFEIIHLDPNQSALKTWKSSSWMTQKKHNLMTSLSAAFSIESLISYNSQLSTWWLTADWVTERSNSSSSLFSIFSAFYTYWNRWVAWEEVIKRERRRILYFHWWNRRDRIGYIRLRKSSRFSIILSSHSQSHRSVRPDSSLWKCFWHDSALHAP